MLSYHSIRRIKFLEGRNNLNIPAKYINKIKASTKLSLRTLLPDCSGDFLFCLLSNIAFEKILNEMRKFEETLNEKKLKFSEVVQVCKITGKFSLRKLY